MTPIQGTVHSSPFPQFHGIPFSSSILHNNMSGVCSDELSAAVNLAWSEHC